MAIQWGLLQPYDVNRSLDQFSKGFLTPFVAGNELQQAKMRQMQVQRAQRQQTALNEYKQTGDVQALMRADPEMGQMAAKADEYIRTRPPDEMVKLAKATQYMQMARPYLNQQTWPTIRQQMMQIGAKENMLPPEKATDEDLYKFAWGTDILHAQITKGPQTFKPGETVSFMGKSATVPYGRKEEAEIKEKEAKAEQERETAALRKTQKEDPFGMKTPVRMRNPRTGEVKDVKYGDPERSDPEWVKDAETTRQMTPDQINDFVRGLKKKEISPSQIPARGEEKLRIEHAALQEGVNLQEIEREYWSTRHLAASMTTDRKANFVTNARSFMKTVPELLKLGKELDLTGYRPLNRAKLEWLVQMRGNTKEGQLAQKYLSLAAGLNTEMVMIDTGGYAPTEEAWKQTFRQLDPKGALNVEMLNAQLESVGTLVKNRLDIMNDVYRDAVRGNIDFSGTSGGNRQQPQGDIEAAKQRYEASKRAWDAEPDSDEKEEALRVLEASRKKYGF